VFTTFSLGYRDDFPRILWDSCKRVRRGVDAQNPTNEPPDPGSENGPSGWWSMVEVLANRSNSGRMEPPTPSGVIPAGENAERPRFPDPTI